MAETPKNNIEDKKISEKPDAIRKEESEKQQLNDQKIDSSHTETLKKLGFNFKEGEKIDQEALKGKMGGQFDNMSNSVWRGNEGAQAKLNGVKQEFLQTLGEESDINKQLELCEFFLKEYDIAASTEKGEYIERSNIQSKNMKEEIARNLKMGNDKVDQGKKKEATEIYVKTKKLFNEETVLWLILEIKVAQNTEINRKKAEQVAEQREASDDIPWAYWTLEVSSKESLSKKA